MDAAYWEDLAAIGQVDSTLAAAAGKTGIAMSSEYWIARQPQVSIARSKLSRHGLQSNGDGGLPWCKLRPESTSRLPTRRCGFPESPIYAGMIERDSAGTSQEESLPDGDDIRHAGPDPRQDPDRGR
jgi:hypothetical protein